MKQPLGNHGPEGPLPPAMAEAIAEKLYRGRLALFAGAGLSRLCHRNDGSPDRLPLWDDLGRAVAAELRFEDAAAFPNPLELFDAIIYSTPSGRRDLEECIAQLVDDSEWEPSEAHHAIKRLPFHTILTTNYDCIFERLLPNERPVVDEADFDRRERVVIKMHGCRKTGMHTLTQEDYRNWAQRRPRTFGFLSTLLREETVLFVGYSLSDPHLDALLGLVQSASDRRYKSYAWLWQALPSQLILRERRDNLVVASIEREDDWHGAFVQVERALERLREGKAKDGGKPSSMPALFARADDADEWKRYAAQVDARFGSANLEGMFATKGYQRGTIKLADIFVPPDLQPWRVDATGARDGANADPRTRNRDSKPSARADDTERMDSVNGAEADEADGRETADHIRGMRRHLAIIGAPGQGKSTLLQWWLLQAVNVVEGALAGAPGANARVEPAAVLTRPVFVSLAHWEADKGSPDLRAYAREHLPKFADVSARAVAHWLAGPVLWLLDGIDEVRDRSKRAALAHWLEAQASKGDCARDEWVVTSRPAGYFETGLGRPWQEFELAPLHPTQTEAVLHKWAMILTQLDGIALDARRVYYRVTRNTGLSRVLKTPLLVTMLVLFFRTHRELPRDRLQFYAHAARVLRETWLLTRTPHVQRIVEHKPYDEALLEELALRATRKRVVSFERSELERVVRAFLEERGLTPQEVDEAWMAFVDAAEEMAGVLVARGVGRFGFLHLTFQEYYAARALAKVTRGDLALQLAGDYWDDPVWREVWDLYVIGLGDDSNRRLRFFETVLANRHELDAFLFRPELACIRWAGLGEAWTAASAWVAERIRTIELSAGALPAVAGGENARSYAAATRLATVAASLGAWERSLGAGETEWLLAKLDDDDGEMRRLAAGALGGAVGEAVVRETLLARLGDPYEGVRRTTVGALGASVREAVVREALLATLDDEDPSVRSATVEAVGVVADEVGVLEALFAMLGDDHDGVRSATVEALGAAIGETLLHKTLLARLGDRDADVRWGAVKACGAVVGDAGVREALLARLDDEDGRVRSAAVRALGAAVGDASVRKALLAKLTDRDGYIRWSAVVAMGAAAGEAGVRETLLARLDDRDVDARRGAVEALGAVVGDAAIREALLARLDDEDVQVRHSAVRAVRGAVREAAVCEALLARLDDEDESVRGAAVVALSAAARDPAVCKGLLARLDDEDENVRSFAAGALSEAAGESAVRQALLASLDDDDQEVRRSAVRALRAAVGEATVREALLARLTDHDEYMRWEVVAALRTAVGETTVREALVARLQDPFAFVRWHVVEALGGVVGDASVRAALLARLGDQHVFVRWAAVEALRAVVERDRSAQRSTPM